MKLNKLNAISPVDGRYRGKTKNLSPFFSEEALIKYRVRVEIEYFIALCELPLPQLKSFNPSLFEELRSIYQHFSEDDALEIKEIEKTTNHDVKAVEYFIKKEFDKLHLQEYKEFIHFGLTSQDINNTAIPLSIKEALDKVYLPELKSLVDVLKLLAEEYKEVSFLARTHGQPALQPVWEKKLMYLLIVWNIKQKVYSLYPTQLNLVEQLGTSMHTILHTQKQIGKILERILLKTAWDCITPTQQLR